MTPGLPTALSPTGPDARVDEPRRRPPDATTPGGSRTWTARGSHVVVQYVELAAHDPLEQDDLPDEHALLVVEGGVTIAHRDHPTVEVAEPAFVVVPAGTSTVTAARATVVVRVLSTSSPGPGRALPPGIRSHPLRTVPAEPGRPGRVFRTSSLMVNWFSEQLGPRDTEALSPHAHEDFDQLSVTLAGDYVHHLRTPWTPRMSQWRDDRHLAAASPSMLRIPPTVIHTTRAVGPGVHSLVDVFAPPRADFLARGWVLNAGDYPEERT